MLEDELADKFPEEFWETLLVRLRVLLAVAFPEWLLVMLEEIFAV